MKIAPLTLSLTMVLVSIGCCGLGGEKKAREYLEDGGFENVGLDSTGMGQWTFVADKDGQSCTGTISVKGNSIKSSSQCVSGAAGAAPSESGCQRMTAEQAASALTGSFGSKDRTLFDDAAHPMLTLNLDDERFENYSAYHEQLGTLSSPRLVSLEQTAVFAYDTDAGPITVKVTLDECHLRSFDLQGDGMIAAIQKAYPDFGLIYFQFQKENRDANPSGNTYARDQLIVTFAEVSGLTVQGTKADVLITLEVKDGAGKLVHEDKVEGEVPGADASGLLNFNFRFKLEQTGEYDLHYEVTDRLASQSFSFTRKVKVK